LDAGKSADTPVALIEQGTSIYQRTVTGTLGTIVETAAEQQVSNPAMIVIGEVVKQASALSWFLEKTEEKVCV
jgi:uroporphyrin-III C-methyltransferase